MAAGTDQASSTPPFNKSPFDATDTAADVILRSCDGEDFYVQSALLTLASPVFATMLTLPQKMHTEETTDLSARSSSPPIIDLADDKESLYQLLLWCGPRAVRSWKLEDIEGALRLADKYDMRGIVKHLGETLMRISAYLEEPMKLYAIGIQYGFEEVARAAAKETLNHPLETRQFVPQLHNISAAALHRLHEYYFACGLAGMGVAKKLGETTQDLATWYPPPPPMCVCPSERIASGFLRSKWWGVYINLVQEELKIRPRDATVLGLIAHAAGPLQTPLACAYCRALVFPDLIIAVCIKVGGV